MSTKNSYKCRYVSFDSKVCESINFMTLEKFQTCLLDLLSMHTRLKKDDIEKYIPQVLNSDKLNTVSYKKGCYTIRSHCKNSLSWKRQKTHISSRR